MRTSVFARVFAAVPLLAGATCPPDPRLDVVTTTWLEHQPQQSLADLSPDSALCFQQRFVAKLEPKLGRVVGYKVGAYTAAARKNYGNEQPAVGVLLKKMMLKAGATVSAASGVALVSEADFLLVVKDEGINDAVTREQAYEHLRGWQPFVELPDLNYLPNPPPNFGQLVALNVSARAGVYGKEVPLAQTPEGFEGLANLAAAVRVTGTPEGEVKAHGRARDTLGDPVEIVLAARDGLKARGVKLRAGDVISIGTLTPPRPVKAGETLNITYTVSPATADIRVEFVP